MKNLKDEGCKLDRNKIAKAKILAKLREINGTERISKEAVTSTVSAVTEAIRDGLSKRSCGDCINYEECEKFKTNSADECDGYMDKTPMITAEECRNTEGAKKLREVSAELVALSEADYEGGPTNFAMHHFKGRLDWPCEVCGKTDRHWIHMKADVETMTHVEVKPPEDLPEDEVEFEVKYPDGTKKTMRGKKNDFNYALVGLTKECLDKAKIDEVPAHRCFDIEVVECSSLKKGEAYLVCPNERLVGEGLEEYLKRSVVRIGNLKAVQ